MLKTSTESERFTKRRRLFSNVNYEQLNQQLTSLLFKINFEFPSVWMVFHRRMSADAVDSADFVGPSKGIHIHSTPVN